MSTGAIVGITLGSIAAGLIVLLVAVFAIGSIGASAARVAEAGSTAEPTPYAAPTEGPSDGSSDGSAVDDYDVDGIHVHYVDGWTFELTAAQTCAGATVTAGFADTPDGGTLDEWSTTVDFEAGVPVTLTIPDSASTHDYAGIDSVQCAQA
jgi:CHASE2 domain-containing sensor protein